MLIQAIKNPKRLNIAITDITKRTRLRFCSRLKARRNGKQTSPARLLDKTTLAIYSNQ
jgi:hypothetical protein